MWKRGCTHHSLLAKATALLQPTISLFVSVLTGAHINHADHAGNTPLHVAACGFDHRGATLLLQLGADKKVKNGAGQTAAQLVRDERKILCKISVFRKCATLSEHALCSLIKFIVVKYRGRLEGRGRHYSGA